ncbi:hypothetical protein Q3G72_026630 [Acer saccharum]|nr:hypothetical protein Q3G72_026630 [Acer saccharum]
MDLKWSRTKTTARKALMQCKKEVLRQCKQLRPDCNRLQVSDGGSSLPVQSPPSDGVHDDIDRRAEIFISNFHHIFTQQMDLKWSRIKTAMRKTLIQCKKEVLRQCKQLRPEYNRLQVSDGESSSPVQTPSSDSVHDDIDRRV